MASKFVANISFTNWLARFGSRTHGAGCCINAAFYYEQRRSAR